MPQVCWYFQLHQPPRLRDFSVFELGSSAKYFDDQKNKEIFRKVAKKSYTPMFKLLLKLLGTFPDFSFALSMSGIWLEQMLVFCPQLLPLLQEMVETGRVEILGETYYHSLAGLYGDEEFEEQVTLHSEFITTLFGVEPRVFRNTELIYFNELAPMVKKLGFTGLLTEAVDRYLHGRSRTQVFRSVGRQPLPLLLKHAQLSDDIAFRFSNKSWDDYPLTAEKYVSWINSYRADELINLFMDFETFGEHQWADTGIFEFFSEVVSRLSRSHTPQRTPSELFAQVKEVKTLEKYDVPEPISWADVDRDLTAWRGNALQVDTLAKLYDLTKTVVAIKNPVLLADWRKLQTSDHFYYMCTKWSADGDVHAYFSPYADPFDAYNRFCVVLVDLQARAKNSRLRKPPKA
jgi:alpha-amylase